jgi:hypothetical protein
VTKEKEAMKSLRLTAIGLAALALTACAALGAAAPSLISSIISGVSSPAVKTTSDTVLLEGTRALVLANNAYQGAANGLAPFVAAKRFTPAQVDRIEALSNKAYDLLQKGDTSLTAAQRAAGVFAIADELNRMIGK